MAYLSGAAFIIFKERAEASPNGSQEESLFSGLAKLAGDIDDIERRLTNLQRDVSNLSSD